MELYDVKLFAYDISRGLASYLSSPLLGVRLDAVWHTSVVVYGREYFYGAHGISETLPGKSGIGDPKETITMGHTEVPKELFEDYLTGLRVGEFQGRRYHVLRHNCNTFTNEVCLFLVGKAIPDKIRRMTEDFMASPGGRVVLPLIESFMAATSTYVQTSEPPPPPPRDPDDDDPNRDKKPNASGDSSRHSHGSDEPGSGSKKPPASG